MESAASLSQCIRHRWSMHDQYRQPEPVHFVYGPHGKGRYPCRGRNEKRQFITRGPMNWIVLIIAGLFEVGFTTCLAKAKTTHGNPFVFWMAGFFLSLTLSMYFLNKAIQTLPLRTAYA